MGAKFGNLSEISRFLRVKFGAKFIKFDEISRDFCANFWVKFRNLSGEILSILPRNLSVKFIKFSGEISRILRLNFRVKFSILYKFSSKFPAPLANVKAPNFAPRRIAK